MSWIGWLATVFGLGLSPVLAGLAGSLAGVLLVLLIRRWPLRRQILTTLLLAFLAVPVADAAEREFAAHDDGRIVIDEAVAFPVATLGVTTAGHPALLAAAFVAYRIFDMVKPPPVNLVESVPGGLGIVLDDVTAALYALLIPLWMQKRRRRQDSDQTTVARTGA